MRKTFKIIGFTIISMILLSSCSHPNDKMVSLVIDASQTDLNRLNTIRRLSHDTIINNYIDSVKEKDLKSSYEVNGVLKSEKNFFYSFIESKEKLKTYIDSCEIKF